MPHFMVYFDVPDIIYQKWMKDGLALWTDYMGEVCDLKINERGFDLMKSVTLIEAFLMHGEETSDNWLDGTDPRDPTRYNVLGVKLRFDPKDYIAFGEEQQRIFIEAFKARYNIIGHDDEGYNYAQYGCYNLYHSEYVE